MCHYTIEVCKNDHKESKRRKCTHCSSWEECIDLARCTYKAALVAGEVERKVVRSRLCEQCTREMIEDMKAKLEQRRNEEAVESKGKAISMTDEDEFPQKDAESSNQLHVGAPIGFELGSVEKAMKESVEVELNAGPEHENQGFHQANPKHLARITKEPVGGKSSDAPGTERGSDFKLKGILEPVIR